MDLFRSPSPRGQKLGISQGLHLTIRQQKGLWECTELSSLESLGWGDYQWVIVGNLPQLPPETVLGIFLYQDDEHEIDALELSRWGQPERPNAQFCLQPSGKDSIRRFEVHSRTITVRLSWREDKVQFTCWEGETPGASQPIADWTYTGPKLFKPGREKVHINFWLMGGKAPASQQPLEVLVKSFSFRPSPNAAPDQ